MNSGHLKTYKYVKNLKVEFLYDYNTFLHSICSEGKKENKNTDLCLNFWKGGNSVTLGIQKFPEGDG